MGRFATLTPKYLESKKLWYLSLPPRLSKTGKRSQEYFQTKKEAESRSSSLRKIDKHYRNLSGKTSPQLMQDAVELNELAQVYGFSGLREAFMTWAESHERKNSSLTFGELLDAHQTDFAENWSPTYLSSRWKPFCKKVDDLGGVSISLMDSDYWRDWLTGWRKKVKPAPATYNQTVSMLKTLFSHEKARGSHAYNPLESIPSLKDVRKDVSIPVTPTVGAKCI